jgi:hypothetical protein
VRRETLDREPQVYVVLPKQHPLANEDSVGWNALKDAHFIVSRDAAGPEIHDFVVRRLADLGRLPPLNTIASAAKP